MAHLFKLKSRRSLGKKLLGVGLLLAGMWCMLGAATEVEARPRILRPGTKPAVYMGGIGGHIGLNTGGGALVIHNTLGYHFSGDSSGPALGGDLDLYIGGFAMLLGPRFWWDIQIAGMAIYVAPYIRPALYLNLAGIVFGAFNLQFGVRGKVILNNIGVLFLEPLAISINMIPTNAGLAVVAGYQLMFGGGVTF